MALNDNAQRKPTTNEFLVQSVCPLEHRGLFFYQVLKPIRENEPRVISLGDNVERYKLMAFTISAGTGTLWGPMIGATVIEKLQNHLANLGGWRTITTGVIFLLCVLALRPGIVGEISHRLKI